METEQLISKKELLARYGISYGALYRWKRKGLIPDEWFIKQSTVTGQETFFPQKLVCERVETILSMKEDVLLDELAQQLSGEEKKQETMMLVTVYGEKTFRMNEVQSIALTDKNGKKQDITQLIRDLLNKCGEQEEKV
ncbi:MAG: DUF4004 family protein [Oscillospiraceae bacterium]|nr:DUF4004 family protein [Oscillospiraceae bacterium]